MKSMSCKSFFKKVNASQVKNNPALANREGQKRPDIVWSFEGYESAADIAAASPVQVAFFLNRAIETFGRDLVADNGANWDFIPSAESLTLAAAFAYYNEESKRERILTKASAAAFALVYAQHAPELLGIEKKAAQAAQAVICEFNTYSKDEKVAAAILARLSSFAEKVAEADEESEIASVMSGHLEVLLALLKTFEPKEAAATVTADAL